MGSQMKARVSSSQEISEDPMNPCSLSVEPTEPSRLLEGRGQPFLSSQLWMVVPNLGESGLSTSLIP